MNPPTLRRMLAALIAAPSISSVNPDWDQSNEPVIRLLADWLAALGLRVEVIALPGAGGKFNLIATAGPDLPGLVLAGHTDTVPFDPQRWRSDPFRLDERDGRLYGLGTCDMKGFFALAIEALRGLSLGRLRRGLTLVATADEESSMVGAEALRASGRPLGRYAVIGEPTGLRPIRMHKGIAMESIRVIGRSGHSSDPSLGRNALEGMHQVIGELLAWRDELQARHRNPAFSVPVPTVNLGRIAGGDNPNRICAECELQIDLRTLPGMALDELRAELAQRLRRRLDATGLGLEMRPLFVGVDALETPTGSPIVTACEALCGHPAGAVAFATEGPFLDALGIDTLILGPGGIEQAHQPDEYLAIDQIEPGIRLLRSLVERFCLEEMPA